MHTHSCSLTTFACSLITLAYSHRCLAYSFNRTQVLLIQNGVFTFWKGGQAAPQLLLQHAVQRFQVGRVVGREEVAALGSEHAPQADALHPTEGFACC